MRNIKIYGGMTGEFEVFQADAPDEEIEKYLRVYADSVPYKPLTNKGYYADSISCHYDFDDGMPRIDAEFDLYDYMEG